MDLDRLIAEYGLWAVGLGAGIEGETVALLGGVMAHRGLIPLLPTILAACLGSFVADQVFFATGRIFRQHRYVRRAQSQPAFARALSAFNRHPILFCFAFRFLYGLRIASPLAIGTTTLASSRFFVLNAAAALLWSMAFVCIGYFFGQTIEIAFGHARKAEHLLAPVLMFAVLIGLTVHLFKRRWALMERIDQRA